MAADSKPDPDAALGQRPITPARVPGVTSLASRDSVHSESPTALMAAAAAVALGYGLVLPIFPDILARVAPGAELDVARHVGFATGAYMAALFATAPLWGAVSDHIGRRPVMVAGLGGFIVALAALASAQSLWAIYIGQIVSGAAAAAVIPASLAAVADGSAPRERTARFAALGAAVTLGLLLGPALSAAATEAARMIAAERLWWITAAPFVMAAAMAVAAGAVVLIRLPAGSAFQSAPAAPGMSQVSLLPVLTLAALAAFGLGILEVGVTLWGQQVLRLAPSTLASAFLVCGLAMLAVQALAISRWLTPGEPRAYVAPGFLAMAMGLLMLTGARGAMMLVLFVGVAAASYSVLDLGLTTRIATAASTGRAFGAETAAGSLGQALGSVAAGLVFSSAPAAPFWVGAGALGVGAGLAWVCLGATRISYRNGAGT